MSFTRTSALRLSRTLNTTRPHVTRRTYASEPSGAAPPSSGGGGNNTIMIIGAALGIPAAFYLLKGKGDTHPTPSEKDKPATRKAPAGEGSISSKQEGLSNADTSHPYVNEPGKSITGEGETETAKFKGTVSPQRPQN
ncbi:hypothetical protein BDW74DRAFT_162371 [Aspergillus multicolor]|uniref:uncharacterized protein n=1 Tax=Aspergillus multicolor TaxID=41759 RepID=UPI003CCD3FB2